MCSDIYNFATKLKFSKSTMFTFGLFSTHLPYIAFAFFYVYLVLFGLGKPDGSSAANQKNYHQSEIFAGNLHPAVHNQLASPGTTFYFREEEFCLREILLTEQWKHSPSTLVEPLPAGISTSLFCRPPPSA